MMLKRLLVAVLLATSVGFAFGQVRNSAGTLVASGAYTATQNTPDMTNDTYRGVHIAIDVTIFGSGTLTVKVQGKDETSGKYYDMLTSAAINATGTTVLKVYPGMTASANVAISESMPHVWRVVLTKSDASSWTYSVGYSIEY